MDIEYGVYDRSHPNCGDARACYLRETTRQNNLVIKLVSKIMIRDTLFCHLDFNLKGDSIYKVMDEEIDRSLLHEIVHKIWYDFLPLEKKLEFEVEGEAVYGRMAAAETDAQKLNFLKGIGFAKPELEDFKGYEELKKKRESYKEEPKDSRFRDDEFFGTELYSTLAGRAFAGDLIIPKHLRKFYEGIISEKYLNKDKL
jgi:hypothetical protein